MFNIGQILNKVRALRESDIGIRTAIKNAVAKYTEIDVPVEHVQIKSGKATIKNISQAARSVVFMKKETILRDISETLQNNKVKDIQ